MWGLLCKKVSFLNDNNALYQAYENEIFFNFVIGLLYGSAYAIFELPNSFVKRRFGVNDSNIKEVKKIKKCIFRIFDLIDSAFGCVLVLALFYDMTVLQYISLVIIGGVFHYIIVAILYKLKIKKQM
jgi:CDP-diglyceride synthetase